MKELMEKKLNKDSTDINLTSVLEKHTSFWNLKNKTAIVQQIAFPNWCKKPYPVKWGTIDSPTEIQADDIDIATFLGINKPVPKTHDGYKMNCLMPLYPQSWMSGIIGCPIIASSVSCSAKGITLTKKVETFPHFEIKDAISSDWYKVLLQYLDAYIKFSENKVAISQFHYRGVIDMLAAYLKEDNLCLALFDHKDELKVLCEKFTDLYIMVAKNDMQKRGFWNDGTVISWGIYAPGELLSYQVDASNLFSADMYERNFLEYDRKIIREFEYSLIHTHYSGLHIIDKLIKIKELDTIQISLDREAVQTWDINLIIKKCRLIQSIGKRILITGELSSDELKIIINSLNSEGLMIFYWLPEKWDPLKLGIVAQN